MRSLSIHLIRKIGLFLHKQAGVDAGKEKCYTVSKFTERVVL